MIPVYDGKKTVFGNRALVGDAAGQVKASSGGGVVLGMLCAEILADAVKKENISHYETEWRKEYGGILNDHLLVRKLLNHMNYDKLLRAANNNDMKSTIENYGDMEDTSALKKYFIKNPLTTLGFASAFF
jgi:flavin-dependent dehydrogenase